MEVGHNELLLSHQERDWAKYQKTSSCCLHLVADDAALAHSMLCPLLSQGRSKSVFPASSGVRGGLCKGFTDERKSFLDARQGCSQGNLRNWEKT